LILLLNLLFLGQNSLKTSSGIWQKCWQWTDKAEQLSSLSSMVALLCVDLIKWSLGSRALGLTKFKMFQLDLLHSNPCLNGAREATPSGWSGLTRILAQSFRQSRDLTGRAAMCSARSRQWRLC